MDFLLVVLSIGGLVFAIVMFILAARTKRMEQESDQRVQTLQAMATGSVLFASDGLVESEEPAPSRWQDQDAELDRVWDEFRDETVENVAVPAAALPYVFTVPATAGAGRVVSFERTERRSRT